MGRCCTGLCNSFWLTCTGVTSTCCCCSTSPPGTGDIAISIAQLIPNAEIIVVTTPQLAAAEVAERAGSIALQTKQRVIGVVENMSGLLRDGSTMHVFGEGGGAQVAERLTRTMGVDVPLLSPGFRWTRRWLPPAMPGFQWCSSAPGSQVEQGLRGVADTLSARRRGLAGMSLGLDTSRH